MGAANAAAGITQGFPVGASGSRTAVNDAMGARSQLAGLVAAAAVLLILLFLTGPIAELPKAVLGAAIVSAAIGLVDVPAWRSLAATDRVELAIAAVTVAGVVIAGVLEAVAFAVALTIVDAVRRSAKPGDAVLGWDESLGRWADVEEHPGARVAPGVVVYRLDDRFFFANARYVKRRMNAAVRGAPSPARWLVLDAEAVTHVDTTGVDAIQQLAGELRDDGITLVVARIRAHTKRQLDEAGLVDGIGSEHFHPTVRAAVAACIAAGSDRDHRPVGPSS
jgi:MFS superfamily sulfate permease-like transporter